MKLFQVQYFCTACEQGNITKAARLLHVSQPSVSTAIRTLEEEFGCHLIEHSNGRGFTLTEEGRYFYQRASQILADSSELARDMDILGKKSGVVCLGASPMTAGRLLPSIYQTIPRKCGIHLQVLECGSGDILEILRSGRLDFALAPINELVESLYAVLEIGVFQMDLAVPSGHPLAGRETIRPQDLKGEPLAYFDVNGLFAMHLNQALEENHIQPNIQCVTSQVYTIQRLVTHGVALSFLFREIIQETPGLCGIPMDPPLKVRTGLIWPKEQNLRPASKIFLYCMKDFPYASFER